MAVHLGNHWTCALINLAKKELTYFDSLGVSHSLVAIAFTQMSLLGL